MRVVHGVIELPQLESAEPATAFIRVEDVSQADGKARRLGQAVVNVTTNDFARGAVAFEVTVQEPQTGAKCGVSSSPRFGQGRHCQSGGLCQR
jgi:hypothetical protein